MNSPWLAKMRSPSATSSGPTVNMMMRCDFPICDMLTPFIRARVKQDERSPRVLSRWDALPFGKGHRCLRAERIKPRLRWLQAPGRAPVAYQGCEERPQGARLVGDASVSRGLRLTSTADDTGLPASVSRSRLFSDECSSSTRRLLRSGALSQRATRSSRGTQAVGFATHDWH